MENNNIFVLDNYFENKKIYYQIRKNISYIRSLKEDLNMNNNIIAFYCSKCKKIFYSKINADSFRLLILNNITSYNLRLYFNINKIKDEEECGKLIQKINLKRSTAEIICPHCHNRKFLKDIKLFGKLYNVYNNYYIHDNKIHITNKIIKFDYNYNYNKNISIYYKERITELFIDIKTGQSKLLIIKDNINKNNIKSLIRDCTYANNIFNYADLNYSNSCNTNQKLIKEVYNIIRDYKIKNNLVKTYIPTFEENNIYYKNKLKDLIQSNDVYYRYIDNNFKDITDNISNLTIFNRFPCINIYDSKKVFTNPILISPFDEKLNHSIKKIRSQIKQNNNKAFDVLLQNNNIPINKINKKNLLDNNYYNYVYLYNKFKNLIDINNFYKLVEIKRFNNYDDIETIANFFKEFKLNKKQENYICNKINSFVKCDKEFSNFNIVVDTLRMLVFIKKAYPDYKVNFREKINILHDITIKDYNRIKTKNINIDYDEYYNEQLLNKDKINCTIDDYKFKLVKDTNELILTGNKLNNCVGSYRDKVLNHNCFIIIMINKYTDEPITCIEIDSEAKYILQAKMNNNSIPNKKVGKIIEIWAKNNKIKYTNDRYDYYERVCE